MMKKVNNGEKFEKGKYFLSTQYSYRGHDDTHYILRNMSTKPKFLLDIEKKLSRCNERGMRGESDHLEVYQEVFSVLIENIQTFGPTMSKVKTGYEIHIRFKFLCPVYI